MRFSAREYSPKGYSRSIGAPGWREYRAGNSLGKISGDFSDYCTVRVIVVVAVVDPEVPVTVIV
jgi:hypothetical protein